MRILVDTQCWLWWLEGSERLSRGTVHVLADGAHELLFSAASSWEIAIKYAAGKLRLPEPPERYVPDRLADQGMKALPVQQVHALRVASLPPHHADPFDRLLVAQAQIERLRLLTADPEILRYDVETIWASAQAPPPSPRRRRRRRARS